MKEEEYVHFVAGMGSWLGCIGLFYLDWSRSIEFPLLWPELDWYWALQHKIYSPSYRSMKEEEYIHFVVGMGLGLVDTAVDLVVLPRLV
jgi:hypothetical protein